MAGSPQPNFALIFKKPPTAIPIPGEHLTVEDIGYTDFTALPEKDGVLLKHLYASFDPYLRELMLAPGEEEQLFPAFTLGKPISTMSIAQVLDSTYPEYEVGDILTGMLPIQQHSVFSSKDIDMYGPLTKIPRTDSNVTCLADYLGALGIPGLTAYSGLYEIGKPRKGETVFISSAAGAVGQMVGQLAKDDGLRVIGSVGSQEKVDFLIRELKFDAAFNYKDLGGETMRETLLRLAPQGIDIYFENVGGEHLEAALDVMNQSGRIVGCGMVSQYNNETPYGVKSLYQVILKRLRFEGFLASDEEFVGPWKEEHLRRSTDMLRQGSLKVFTTEVVGVERAAEGFVGMLKGQGLGKVVLKFEGTE